jgi:leader peptidase (prepilin peptidase)/N-methyltransferase
MVAYYAIMMFIFGTCFGSFYNVVGYRTPRNMSIIKPNSHCTTCNHELNIKDLFPILSYIFLKGKCRYCGAKVGLFYPIFETITGLLFSLCYLKYGFSLDLIVALVFVSMSLIIIISDYQTMIIPDSVLIVSSILILCIDFINVGPLKTGYAILNGVIAFICMYLLKLCGDFLFKKESMGGGDIKLMFVFGLVLGWPTAILAIFTSSFIGLPASFIMVAKSDSHEIPFGPFLVIAAMILMLSGIDMNFVLDLMTK